MNAKQEAKLNMYRATQKHCEDNNTVFAGLSAFVTTFNAYKAKVAAIIAAVQQEDLVTKGITVDKAQAKKSLCQLAADVAASIFAFASATNNSKLKQEVNFSYSDLFKSKDDELAPRCQNIFKACNSNIAGLASYGITLTTLSSFQTAIDSYQIKVPNPRNAAALKITIRNNIKELIKETDTILKEQMDKTITALKATNPDFIKTYKTNRVILDPSKAMTIVSGQITNSKDKTQIANSTITIEELNFSTATNDEGFYEIKPITAGLYTIIIKAEKFVALTSKDIKVKQGQINRQNFELDPL